MEIKPIGYIENDYDDKFAVPRQSNIAPSALSTIHLVDEYAKAEAVRGISEFSHLWVIWEFDKAVDTGALTVRPPRLGGNIRMGVFATRSPYRPNSLGLSSVRLERVEYDDKSRPTLIVSGADLINGTPIYDIKPYIKLSDCHEEAVCGFVDEAPFHMLRVEYAPDVNANLSPEQMATLTEILENDPRPAYQHEDGRIYGFAYAKKEVKFCVSGDVLTIVEIADGK